MEFGTDHPRARAGTKPRSRCPDLHSRLHVVDDAVSVLSGDAQFRRGSGKTGLVLAISDQFSDGVPGSVSEARAAAQRIRDEYERAYYAGIICERRAKVVLHQTRLGSEAIAYHLLREAKGWYERAEALRPPGNDDVLLRWNSCARLIMRHPQVMAATVGGEAYQPYVD